MDRCETEGDMDRKHGVKVGPQHTMLFFTFIFYEIEECL